MSRALLLSVAAIAGLAAATSGALACNIDGNQMVAYQSNNTAVTFYPIHQVGETLDGWASFRDVQGTFNGSLKRNGSLLMIVTWSDGTSGVYSAHISNSGQLSDGRTYEAGNTSNAASWGLGSARTRLRCQ